MTFLVIKDDLNKPKARALHPHHELFPRNFWIMSVEEYHTSKLRVISF